ncbi:MAG: Anthranilate synthase component 1 [Nitrospira sp.]
MIRVSLPSKSAFLDGPPQPLVLTLAPSRSVQPVDLYARLASTAGPSFLLDSGSPAHGSGRFSYLGSGPTTVFSNHQTAGCTLEEDPFHLLRQELAGAHVARTPQLPPFFGGAVGYLSYDFARRLERLPAAAPIDLPIPDLQFALYDLVTALDHDENHVHIIFCPSITRFLGEDRSKLLREGLDRIAACEADYIAPQPETLSDPVIPTLSFVPEQPRDAYLDRVGRCQRYIAAGDIYQANLSHRFNFRIPDRYRTPSERLRYEQALYRRLSIVNPSPFSGLLRFDDLALISASPERLVRVRGGRADTRPIAGTRPRGRGPEEDRRLVDELLRTEKERAEHVMLVDLERNDLGRVCEFGSVHVDEFMGVEQYSHVSHIVSNISGRLRQDVSPFDVIRAIFPGGTITGVPKIRCMEIIDELEPVRRGPYTGSFGYIGWNGDVDLNIIIRTLVLSKDTGYLQVGAGIVADSDPALEYDETLHKAEAFFAALERRD